MMDASPSYYEVLIVSPNATDEDIKRAYHTLAKKFHPDANPHNRRMAELRFRLISEAYSTLKSNTKRGEYDQALRLKAQNDNAGRGFFSQVREIFWPSKGTRS